MEAAGLVIESRTGAIRAMVGGWDFERNKFNRITQARRQVGSAFKPFVYGSAIVQGWTPADTLLDAPTSFLGADGKLTRFGDFNRGVAWLQAGGDKALVAAKAAATAAAPKAAP